MMDLRNLREKEGEGESTSYLIILLCCVVDFHRCSTAGWWWSDWVSSNQCIQSYNHCYGRDTLMFFSWFVFPCHLCSLSLLCSLQNIYFYNLFSRFFLLFFLFLSSSSCSLSICYQRQPHRGHFLGRTNRRHRRKNTNKTNTTWACRKKMERE